MFKFLKRFFKDEETEETVEQDKLLFWFDDKVKERLKKLDNEIKILFDGVENRKQLILARIEDLKNTEIKDPEKIENKIKNVVLGHRENYARALNIFLNELHLPEERTILEAMKFNDLLKEKLNKLGETTGKSYAASQHLFFDQVQAIVRGLKDLNDLSRNFDKVVEKNKLKEIEKAKLLIEMFYKKINEKDRLNMRLKEQKNDFEDLFQQKQKRKDEIEVLEASDDYKNYLNLKEQKESVEAQIRENQSKFLQLFAQLERALRKYEHVAVGNLNLIRDYLDNPINAFFNDSSLVFLKILESVRKNLESGINLKESKMEKTIEVINMVDEKKLKEIKERHNQLMEEKSIIVKKIDNSHVYGKLSDLRYRLEHYDVQVADLEQEIKELEEFLEKIDLNKIIFSIVEKVFDVFRVKLVIH